MKYVIEADLSKNDCSFCPGFDLAIGEHRGHCLLSEEDGADDMCFHDVAGVLRESESGDWAVWCYDRPDWCPLVTFEECLIREWVENASSQPEKDEEKTVVRLELYESEWAKAGALSLKYRLTMAQTIAMLIERAYGNEVPH